MNALDYLKNHPKHENVDFDGESPIIIRFNRNYELPEMLNALKFLKGAEIGTEKGRFAGILYHNVPGLDLYCVDPYESYDEAGATYSQEYMDMIMENAHSRLLDFGARFIRKSSIEAVKDFEPNSLDFVFIDGNHKFEYVYEDITEWTKVVKPGGLVIGHDYEEKHDFGVVKAIKKYTKKHNINPWFHLYVPHHAVKRSRSNFVNCWMFIK